MAVTLQEANLGDPTTLIETVTAATENLRAVADDARVEDKLDPDWMSEAVADKGYHSNGSMTDLAEMDVRSYVAEPKRGRRDWSDEPHAQPLVYGNRRRIRGERGKRLMRRRGELIERSFAHCYETGAMRRTHLRRHENIAKRLLVHVGAFNLSLVMRKLLGFGKPRRMQGLFASFFGLMLGLWSIVRVHLRRLVLSVGARINFSLRLVAA